MIISYCTELLDKFRYIIDIEPPHKRDPAATRIFMSGEGLNWELEAENLNNHPVKFELFYMFTDRTFTRNMLYVLLPNLIHVYAHNCDFQHPMVTQLPLGFLDSTFLIKKTPKPRDILCYMNFDLHKSEFRSHVTARLIRQNCVAALKGLPWVTYDQLKLKPIQFYEKLMRSKFVICPYGVGIDTYRFYETCWYGATPIVMSSGLDSLHRKFGALIVNDWSEITEQLLDSWEYKPVDPSLYQLESYTAGSITS
jgi:hypothetical protein